MFGYKRSGFNFIWVFINTHFRVTESVMFGAYMLGQTLVYAPSFNNARKSASKILSVVKRVPAVRTEDGVKDKPDWVIGVLKQKR